VIGARRAPRWLAQVAILAIALLVMLPPVEAAPKKTRPTLKKTTRANRTMKGAGAKQQKKLRADRGHIAPGRSALRAKVATGDHPRAPLKPGRRADLLQLPLSEQIAQRIEELLHGPLRDGTTSLFVADARTGEPIFSVYPDDPLNPASNVKLISTAAALDILGPDFRYVSRVLGPVPDDAGNVVGDVYLFGSYDPTLGRKAMQDLATQLAASGVKRVAGDVLIGGTPTRDGTFRSFVDLRITAGPVGQPPQVTMEPSTEFFQVVVNATTVPRPRTRKQRRRLGLSVETKWILDAAQHKRLQVTIGGQIAEGRAALRDIWTRERGYFGAHLLRQAMRDAGIEVVGDVRVLELRDYVDTALGRGFIPVPLAEHRSQRLAEIIQRVNKRSTNWLADRIVMTAAARRYGGLPSIQRAVDAMYEWLQRRTGLTREQVVIDSGSGLSYRTELSARQVVAVLRAGLGLTDEMTPTPRRAAIIDAFASSLAVGGVDGTIRKRFRTLHGTVRGKTGTLQRVVSLAGVIEVAPDRAVVFSIITNGHHPRWKRRVRDAHERLVGLLCDYLNRRPLTDVTPVTDVPETPVDPNVVDEEDGEDAEPGDPGAAGAGDPGATAPAAPAPAPVPTTTTPAPLPAAPATTAAPAAPAP